MRRPSDQIACVGCILTHLLHNTDRTLASNAETLCCFIIMITSRSEAGIHDTGPPMANLSKVTLRFVPVIDPVNQADCVLFVPGLNLTE